MNITAVRVSTLAKEKGVKQSFLNDAIGGYRGKITEWKNEKSTPTDEEICILARILNTSSAYLKGDTDDPTPPGQKEKPATNGELERITSIFMELPLDEQQNVVEYVEFRAASRKKKESQ